VVLRLVILLDCWHGKAPASGKTALLAIQYTGRPASVFNTADNKYVAVVRALFRVHWYVFTIQPNTYTRLS